MWNKVLLLVMVLIGFGRSQPDDFEKLGLQEKENSMEFVFVMPGGSRECFYQYLTVGSKLKTSFRVLTAKTAFSNNLISMAVRGPTKKFLMTPHMKETFESAFMDITDEGVHEICFNNFLDRLNSKKTQMFIGVINPHVDQATLSPEANETSLFYHNLTQRVMEMLGQTHHIAFFLRFDRRVEMMHQAYLDYLIAFVERVSLLMSAIICGVAYFQTYMLKRMFNVKLLTPTNKPRA